MASDYGFPTWERPGGLKALSVSSTAYYAVQCPEQEPHEDTLLLLTLHGWGQNCRSFLRKFAALKTSDVLVAAPQAPHQFYTDMATRKVGFGWMTDFDRYRAVQDVAKLLDAVIADIERQHGPQARLFLLGFSQGVSVAYRYALLGTYPVAGVIACGGDMPPDVAEYLPRRKSFPVLLVHGRQDAIVPFEKCEAAAACLAAAAYPHETLPFDGKHDIPGDAIEPIHDWMSGVARSANS